MITRRFASTVSGGSSSTRKIVLVGAGFLGSYVARALIADPRNRVVLVSRNPKPLYDRLSPLGSQILPPHSADITASDHDALREAMSGASAVVSMAGLLVGSPKQFYDIAEKGAENVVKAAKEAGVGRMVMISAIGADINGVTPYQRTKAAGEKAFLDTDPGATIIRPSIIFGPGDSFFTRFATLARYLPFLPVFGGGVIRFQPVYAGDIARAVEICCRDDQKVVAQVGGKIIEAGGPDTFTYREIMQLVLRYSGLERRRAIISLPYWLGMIQAFFLEKLPESIFTVTRDQVSLSPLDPSLVFRLLSCADRQQIRQLRNDNIVSISPTSPLHSIDFASLLTAFPSSLPSSSPPGDAGLNSVYKILPSYLGPAPSVEQGKRTHGRGSVVTGSGKGFEEIQRMNMKK